MPLDSDVPIVAKYTDEEAATGVAPRKISTVELVTPKPIPSVPSINWAIAPANAKLKKTPNTPPMSRPAITNFGRFYA